MCGRFVMAKTELDLVAAYDAEAVVGSLPEPSFNIAPTQRIAVLVLRPDQRDAGGKALAPFHREFYSARWGLVPKWQQQPRGAPLINARIESLLQKPSFRAAAQRRCVVPASGYYEWQTANSSKQPFFISAATPNELINLAGLCEWWRVANSEHEGPPGGYSWLLTVALITTEAPKGLAEIHDRAPLIVRRQDITEWLDPSTETTEELLQEFKVEAVTETANLSWYPVDRAVGSIRNNGPELIERA